MIRFDDGIKRGCVWPIYLGRSVFGALFAMSLGVVFGTISTRARCRECVCMEGGITHDTLIAH